MPYFDQVLTWSWRIPGACFLSRVLEAVVAAGPVMQCGLLSCVPSHVFPVPWTQRHLQQASTAKETEEEAMYRLCLHAGMCSPNVTPWPCGRLQGCGAERQGPCAGRPLLYQL